MPTVAKCPECSEPMKLSDAAAGKRVRCPGCKHIFVAPGGEEDSEVVECDLAEEPVRRPAKRPIPEEDEEYARPRRSISRDDEEDDRPRRRKRDDDDDDDDRPVERKRKRATRQVQASSGPLILAILACVLFCAPIFGIPLAQMAIRNANEEMDRLPNGRRYESAHQQLRLARTLGLVATIVSTIWVLILIVVTLAR